MRKTMIVVAAAVLAVSSTSLSTSASAFGLVPLGGFGLIHPGFGLGHLGGLGLVHPGPGLAHPGGGFALAHPGEGYGLGHFDGSFGGHRFGGSPYHGGYDQGGETFYRGYAYRAAISLRQQGRVNLASPDMVEPPRKARVPCKPVFKCRQLVLEEWE